ncbi:hypothetical protein [Methylomonas koyamae]|uniref:hypothetical protein n=1 Tax=Methylomonas koyamae TaxID=702114 RepID=UPI002873B386|nr:hypothetical protein [Methylomonas koyamae]WNB74695.1 hypothetical protein RI210_15595 [Methylomonas koyamae]
MALETIPIVKGFWHLLRWLPGVLLRWHFSRGKLAQLIYVDIRPRHNSAVVDLSESTSFSLYLMAINLSPFSVELDRAVFQFWLGNSKIDASILKKQVIAPGEIASLYISATIPEGPANQFAKHLGNPVALDGHIEFNCNVRPFAKTVGRLDGIIPVIYNANVRKDA